jgi:hypothetical protein
MQETEIHKEIFFRGINRPSKALIGDALTCAEIRTIGTELREKGRAVAAL